MKQKDQSYIFDFEFVRLSFQDVRAIYKVIQEFDKAQQNHSDITIEIGGYILSDIEELSDLSDSSYNSIDIRYYNGRAGYSIYLCIGYLSYLKCSYTPDKTEQSPLLLQGAFNSIKTKLVSKEIKPTFFKKFLEKSHLFGFLGGPLLFLGLFNKKLPLTIIGLAVFLYSLLSILLNNWIKEETSIIYNEKTIEEKKTFFQKYKENIILVLITSLISTAIGIIGTLLIQWIISP